MSDADGKWDEELNGLFAAKDRRIAELEAALRPFAEAYRKAKALGVPDRDDISFPVPELESAAKLVQ